jgi:hypothetical protein
MAKSKTHTAVVRERRNNKSTAPTKTKVNKISVPTTTNDASAMPHRNPMHATIKTVDRCMAQTLANIF